MNQTDNLHLRLPEPDDYADIEDLNYNFQEIDSALVALLPAVTTSDNGKFLRVVEGAWTASSIASASGGSF
jgi:hypothetical protein